MVVVLDNMHTALCTLAKSPPGMTVGGVDILGDHVSAEQKAAGHVFSVEGLQSFMKN